MSNDFQSFQREERDEYRSRFKFTDDDYKPRRSESKSREKTKTDYLIRLILLQSVLSIFIVSGVFIASKISPDLFAQIKEDYGSIMQENMSTGDIASELKKVAEFVFKPVEAEKDAKPAMADVTEKAELNDKYSVSSYEVTSDETGETIAVGKIIENGSGGSDIKAKQAAKGTSFADYYVSVDPVMPVEGARITSRFGYRTHPITENYGFHTGLDLAAAEGTPVVSSFYGKVAETGEDDAWGKYVIMEHSESFRTFYCHLSEIYVKEGAVIRQGETVGLVGSTGWSTGPHLHFEVRINGIRVDPELLLYPENAHEA